MLDRPGLEDDREEALPIGECECCNSGIMPWEDYYDIEGILIHDDCGVDYLQQFKKYA
ncbi:hypothetical protein CPJCM30710_10960 [Clostridium polyendosporum]|uniref:Uncharacterized protein n=1 Tax=Clostridium polyendosporum TaxID=69208 RepID=A0A919RXQ2_9CLOT|nr:hypothetical protein [Clostridium polyendosporum]GIM28430.1 hypothetical protein CPJCM30710_10960 [Clostridium polyendosporum]